MNSIATHQTIEGLVEAITYHNTSNGFAVLKVKVDSKDDLKKSDLVVVVGRTPNVNVGEYLQATGEWVINKTYGEQFSASEIKLTPPSSLSGIEKYLSSGAINGIGPAFAAKLVKAFGEDVFEVIEKNPNKLLEVENVGKKRIELITASWKETAGIRNIMVFLQTHGITPAKSAKIYKTYGDDAISILKANPYQLIKDIPGIGFKTADQIATHFGVDKQSQFRAIAAINFLLTEKLNYGHCAYPKEKLLFEAQKLLETDDETLLTTALYAEIESGFLVSETIESFDCIYLKSIYLLEKSIVRQWTRLKEGTPPWPIPENLDMTLSKTEKALKLKLAPLQKLAIHTALTNKITIITGGPGTGKSTLTKALTNFLKDIDIRIALCSPTGRAAKRLHECTGIEAKTIHRLLAFDPEKKSFKYDLFTPLETDLVLVDEASMLDISLANSLLKSIPDHAALVIIGDVDQLPPVGPGQFLKDLIDSEVVPVVRLTQIFRQSSESQLVQAAHQINQGLIPDLTPHRHSDFFFLEKPTSAEVVETILDLVQRRIPQTYHYNPISEIQILAPMQRGPAGVKNLNSEIQKALNPNPIAKIERYETLYCVGDKVMIIENNYEKDVFNGDIGLIDRINFDEQVVYIDLDGRVVAFSFSELDTVVPSYAITIHKSQGSEYPVVIIPIVSEHHIMLQRNLVYTAMTRGKKLVIMVGDSTVLRKSLHNMKGKKRWTNLKSLFLS